MRTLYDLDYDAWLQDQIKLLKQKQFDKLDMPHLLEEMEDLGSSQRNAIESFLVIIMMHMIKQHLQPERSGSSWDSSIADGRVQIAQILEKNPSLKRYPQEIYSKCYIRAVKAAAKEMKIEARHVPGACPWSLNHILGE